ncbi:hypothetical protein LMG27174_04425 [Paraburkholderia rhynchosiae]|uniref:Uncharacterized protein n=1 Tax=Paraburkholderia rhynchosiae TaxID=487049 RepID=A0A6J5BPK9_9BURK|nr:hypothetical protein LMG27174_04425 [Paraburkholderia rhynchosiae]
MPASRRFRTPRPFQGRIVLIDKEKVVAIALKF